MIFSRLFFLYLFFPICFLCYFATKKNAYRNTVLIVFSLLFYAWGEPSFLWLLVLSALVNYLFGRLLERFRDKGAGKLFLALALILNLGVLIGFKYTGFVLENINAAFSLSIPIPDLPLPLGISFYTFRIVSYLIDCAWGKVRAERNFFSFLLYVSLFPITVSGPIVRYETIQKELHGRTVTANDLSDGLGRIAAGLGKKVILADNLGVIVEQFLGNNIASQTTLGTWYGVVLYALQMYFDFSGYSDMAIGISRIFGFHLEENFRHPFLCRDITEFWQRWHITLGGWARDYVFYPFMKSRWLVSFSRKTKKKFGKRWGKFLPWCVANAVLWFVMGFWHGSVQHIFGVSLWFWTVLFFSELFQPLCQKITTKLEFKTESFGWHLFQSLRTYIIYALGVVFFSASGLKEALIHYAVLLASLRRPDPWTLFDGTVLSYGATWRDINVLILSVLCLTIADALREKYTYARLWIKEQSFGLRWCIWLFLFVMVLIFGLYGPTYDASSFIYQGF